MKEHWPLEPAVYQIKEDSLDKIFGDIRYERLYREARANIVDRYFKTPSELFSSISDLIGYGLSQNHQPLILQKIVPVELRLTTARLQPLIKAHKAWIASGGKDGVELVLNNSDLRFAFLCDADLQGVDLQDTNLNGAILCNSNLEKAKLRGCDFIGTNIRGARLRKANLQNARLYNSSFSHADLIEVNLERADLSGANLNSARLMEANLTYTNFVGADLTYADLSNAETQNTNFQLARLIGTKGVEEQAVHSNAWYAGKKGGATTLPATLETGQLVRIVEQELLQSPMIKLVKWVISIFFIVGTSLWLGGTIYAGIQVQSIKEQSERVIDDIGKQRATLKESSRNAMADVKKVEQDIAALKSALLAKIADDRLEIDSFTRKMEQEIDQRKSNIINHIANEEQKVNAAANSAFATIAAEETKSRIQIDEKTINAVDAITRDKREAKKALDLDSLLELSKIQDQIAKLKKSGKPIKFFEFQQYLDNTTQILLLTLSFVLIVSFVANIWMLRRISKK